MVAVCDILGFKKLLYSRPLDKIVNDDFGYLRKAIYSSIHKSATPDYVPTIKEIKAQDRVGFAWFSDTVLLYSLEDNDERVADLIETASWLIMETILTTTVRMRIGISYGQVFIDQDNEIYLGRAIADAFYWQEKQQWSGGLLSNSAAQRIPKNIVEQNFPFPWNLVSYKVPLKLSPKDGFEVVDKNNKRLDDIPWTGRTTMLALDWTRFIHRDLRFLWSEDKPEPDYRNDPKDLIVKWRQTRDFHDAVCKFCNKKTQEV